MSTPGPVAVTSIIAHLTPETQIFRASVSFHNFNCGNDLRVPSGPMRGRREKIPTHFVSRWTAEMAIVCGEWINLRLRQVGVSDACGDVVGYSGLSKRVKNRRRKRSTSSIGQRG